VAKSGRSLETLDKTKKPPGSVLTQIFLNPAFTTEVTKDRNDQRPNWMYSRSQDRSDQAK